DREETRGSLDFGRRAKLVRNKPLINIEVDSEPSVVMKALVAKELLQVQLERDALLAARDGLLAENASLREQQNKAAGAATATQESSARQCAQLQEERRALQRRAQEVTEALAQVEEEKEDLQTRCWEEVEEQKRLLEASENRVAALLEEQAVVDRGGREATSSALKMQESHAVALAQLEDKLLSLRSEWQGEFMKLEQSKVTIVQQFGRQTADLGRQLSEARAEVVRLQEERAATTQRSQEDRSALLRHWHEEVMRLREEKAAAVASLEEEKLALNRRWQAELAHVQAAKESAVAELEKEKASLRKKWQASLEELSRLQAQSAALEGKLREEHMAKMSALETQRAEAFRRNQEELGRLLEEKAAESAELQIERVALHRRLNETLVMAETDKAAIESRLEQDKADLQSRLHEVCKENANLIQEQAALSERVGLEAAAVQYRQQEFFLQELQNCRAMRAEEVSRLGGMLAASAHRQAEAQSRSDLLEAELAKLRRRRPDASRLGGGERTARVEEVKPCMSPTSPFASPASLEGSPKIASISLFTEEEEAQLEAEAEPEEESSFGREDCKEGKLSSHHLLQSPDQLRWEPQMDVEASPAESNCSDRSRHPLNWGRLWSPSLADLIVGGADKTCVQSSSKNNEELAQAANEAQQGTLWNVMPRRIELDLEDLTAAEAALTA
ncbi:unnamed protein product, partial [Polarella glacialis]